MRRATHASVAVASVLIVVKLAACLVTDSVALLSSLIDSTLDALASFLNLLAVRHALTPADAEHRFGHGKAEPLAGLGQAAFIAGSAVFLLFEATRRFVHPDPVEHPWLGVGVMVISIVLTILLVAYQKHVVARTGSIAIGADLLHYLGDVLVNGGVIVALLLTALLGWHLADPLIAIAIAIYILRSAWGIIRGSLDQLMDTEAPADVRRRIESIVRRHPQVTGLHDLRTRVAGHTTFVQLHLELPGDLSLARAHAIADEVLESLAAEFPGAEILIHQDPAGIGTADRGPVPVA